MSLAVTFNPHQPEAHTRGMIWKGSMAFSGTYPTGGESVSTSFPARGSSQKPHMIDILDDVGYLIRYDAANNKVKVFSGVATELAAGAYPAGLTGATVRFTAYGGHLD